MRKRLPSIAAAPALAVALLLLGGCAGMDPHGKQIAANKAEAEAAASRSGVVLKLARAARDAGDLHSAVNLYKSAISHPPVDDHVRVELGEAQLGTGAIDAAIATFNKVGAKSPAQLGAALGLERAELMLREPAKALVHADRAVALAPRNKRALVGRGVALDMLGHHAKAQASYRAAVAIDPYDVAARSNLALSLALTRQYDEAIRIMTPIARAPSATPRLRQNLALIYGLKGDQSAARALSRSDLTVQQTDGNMQFFAMVRDRAH